jgi:hypothetical protein
LRPRRLVDVSTIGSQGDRTFADSPLEGSGFELPVPREKHGPTAPAIITLARRLEGLGGEFGAGQLSGRAGRPATWIQRQLSAAILLLIRGNPSSI